MFLVQYNKCVVESDGETVGIDIKIDKMETHTLKFDVKLLDAIIDGLKRCKDCLEE